MCPSYGDACLGESEKGEGYGIPPPPRLRCHLRDVKASNLAVGKDEDAGTVYMLDFGFARRYLYYRILSGAYCNILYRNGRGEQRARRPGAALLGTMPYASRAAHLRLDDTRDGRGNSKVGSERS